jgi:hypothetical protein
MGGGKEMLMLISTAAIVGKGTTIANVISIVPKRNFFILLSPYCSNSAWVSPGSAACFPNAANSGQSCLSVLYFH